uniref:Uncharacterized protein n=1 Tax=Fagus sylvatica TaxID=28930 RepID=A0A2N9ENV0_FAGSY
MLSLLLVPVSSMWSNVRVMVLEWAINAGLLGVVFGDMFEGLGFLMESLWDYGLNGGTTLDCAVVGGYAASTQVSKLLPDASDDVNSLDPNGKRLGDLIAPISNSAFNSWKKLEVIPELYIPFRSGRNGRKISYRYFLEKNNNNNKEFISGRGGYPVGRGWGEESPPETGWGGYGGWGRDNGAGAGDGIPAPLPSLSSPASLSALSLLPPHSSKAADCSRPPISPTSPTS